MPPAGFGKTTLISTWAALHYGTTSNSPLVAWVSLDEGDNDPIRFWRYVLTASQKYDVSVSNTVLKLLHTTQPTHFEVVLTSFINELSTLPACVLVLDDYHLINSSQVHEALAFLLDHLPATLHIIIASRDEPALPLARWRAHGDVLDLGAADLRFSIEETQAFLEQALPYVLPLQTISYLHARTEGWGCRASSSCTRAPIHKDEQDQDHTLMAFTANYGPIEEYLVDDVLNTQPEWMQNFLLRTSI